MMTVNEVSKLSGLSVRTLHYYDEIGLLTPVRHDGSGYRLYDSADLQRLQQIMLFRELEFSLKDIKNILNNPDFSMERTIEGQIRLLTIKRDHLDQLIKHAREIKYNGGKNMSFTDFETKKFDEYAKRAKEQWGRTEAYKEYELRSKGLSESTQKEQADRLMDIFREFGELMQQGNAPAAAAVQDKVKKLQGYISDNFYTCTDEILKGLGQMYAAGGEFTDNIDAAGGRGTAEFASEAIDVFCL